MSTIKVIDLMAALKEALKADPALKVNPSGYSEGLACSHEYWYNGTTCGDPAQYVLWGMGLCENHFEDRVRSAGNRAGEVRAAAKPVPA